MTLATMCIAETGHTENCAVRKIRFFDLNTDAQAWMTICLLFSKHNYEKICVYFSLHAPNTFVINEVLLKVTRFALTKTLAPYRNNLTILITSWKKFHLSTMIQGTIK